MGQIALRVRLLVQEADLAGLAVGVGRELRLLQSGEGARGQAADTSAKPASGEAGPSVAASRVTAARNGRDLPACAVQCIHG